MSEEHVKSLVPKCYKSILINLSKNVFSLPRKWQDFDFQRFIKTDYFSPQNAINLLKQY